MKNNKILIVNPHSLDIGVEPYEIDYLADSINQEGNIPVVWDHSFSDIDQLPGIINQNEFLYIAVLIKRLDNNSFLNPRSYLEEIKNIIFQLRELSDGEIVLWGEGYSIDPVSIFNFMEADFGIKGDTEYILNFMVMLQEKPEEIFKLPGLVFKKDGETIFNNAVNPEIAEFPWTSRSHINNKLYYEKNGIINIESKKGYASHFIFSTDPFVKGKRFRTRDFRNIENELFNLKQSGIHHFHFTESKFNSPYQHAEGLCIYLRKANVADKLSYTADISPAPMTWELAEKMADTGCTQCNIIAGHLCDDILKRINAGYDYDSICQTCDILNNLNIKTSIFLTAGFPGETLITIDELLDKSADLKVSSIHIQAGIRVFPNTVLGKVLSMARTDKQKSAVIYPKNPQEIDAENISRFIFPVFYVSPDIDKIMPDNLTIHIKELTKSDSRYIIY